MTAIATEPNLVLVDGELILKHEGEELWRLPLSAIRVVGEYTNEDGPFAEDWFAVLVTNDEECFFVELTAANSELLSVEVSIRLGVPIEFHLVYSTTFASRIVLPLELAGRPLFRFDDASEPTLAARLKRLIGVGEVQLTLTDEATSALSYGLAQG